MGVKQEIQKNHTYAEKVILFSREEAMASFRLAQSLVSEMINMIETNKPCVDMMRKNMDAISFLRHGQKMIVQDNLGTCFKKYAMTKSLTKNKEIRVEMMKVIKMFYK